MIKKIFTFGALVAVILVGVQVQRTEALSCAQPEPNNSFIANGGMIFVGSVTSNVSIGTAFVVSNSVDKRKVTFNVERVWSNSTIATPFSVVDNVPPVGGPPFGDERDPWGFRDTFKVGKRYIVYAEIQDGEYLVNIGACASSRVASSQVIANLTVELGQGYVPKQTVTKPPTTGGTFTSGLLAQIQSLLTLVSSLQQQLANIENNTVVNDFGSCVAKTGIVLESYPRQCIYNSQTFVEVIKNTQPPPPTFSCPTLSQNLWQGVKGPSVASLQQFLLSAGTYTYPEITGYYGPATQQAVEKWQAQNGVVSFGTPNTTGYGVVGPATRAAISRVCGGVITTPITPITPTTPTVCTLEYAPVCGQKQVQCFTTPCNPIQTTYSNTCQLKASGAQYLHEGQCRTGIPPISGNPVIQGFTGPTTLRIDETGIWKIRASDPQNGPLSYKIDWGERKYKSAFDSITALANYGFVQNATFTHTYKFVGEYIVSVTVRDNQGLTAKTTITVSVTTDEAEIGFDISPTTGTAPLAITATATLPPRSGYDLVEICGPINIGTIYWGDGTQSQPTRLGCSSQRIVTLVHTYQSGGTYPVSFLGTDGTTYSKTLVVGNALVSDPASASCVSSGVTYSEGSKRECIDRENDGSVECVSDASYACRAGAWQIEGDVGGRVCTSGTNYGGGYYEQCITPNDTLSVFQPSGGFYNFGDEINVRWSTNISDTNSGMYLVLEDSVTGTRFTSTKVNKSDGQATINVGSSCNFFFSDGIDGACTVLRNNISNGGLRYRIKAVIYSPKNACFGFCAPGSTTTTETIIESYSLPFTIS